MHPIRLIIRSFTHYLAQNLWASAGFAVATAIITGSLIVGDSMSHSLELSVNYRLGNITHTVTAGDRLFTQGLASRLGGQLNSTASAALKLDGTASVAGGQARLNRIQVMGVDSLFGRVMGTDFPFDSLGVGEVVISRNMAEQLSLDTNDFFQLTMTRASLMPLNTPFVSDANQTISRRVQVKAIASDSEFGRFNLQVSQTAPPNVFVSIGWINQVMELDNRANLILISASSSHSSIKIGEGIQNAWSIDDANLTLEHLRHTNQWELKSSRVFIQEAFTHTIPNLFEGSTQHLTYFVNSLEHKSQLTPYSFVAAGDHYGLEHNEMIINRWLAEDINAQAGDTVYMEYYEIGPLRELLTQTTKLRVKEIVAMDSIAHYQSLTPHIPGLSDAGSCTEWEAGVPIELASIRTKDEDYWDNYRGTPKAYIALSMGQNLWSNRFGNLTSIRFNATSNEQEVSRTIASNIKPAAIGFQVNEVRAQGLEAASNAVDFTELFMGLSFFVLVSGIILSLLILIYNFRQRESQIKLYASLGFTKKLIRLIYLSEGLIIALFGAVFGTLLAVIYSHQVFKILNSVWHDIVRTNLLEVSIQPITLAIGFLSSVVVAVLFIWITVSRQLMGGVKITKTGKGKTSWRRVRAAAYLGLPLVGISIVAPSLIQGDTLQPAQFFATGTLLLIAFIVFVFSWLSKLNSTPSYKVTQLRLALRSIIRNRNRSLSTIVLLALGTFLVISTGSNHKVVSPTLGSKAYGTGGFAYYAEATTPILHNLNSREQQQLMDLPLSTHIVQMSAAYDDDASCLNLNQVANPRILGVNPKELQGRFTFARITEQLSSEDPWQMLDKDIGFAIPAVADQGVIQWGLGKKIGDTLTYINENGRNVHLVLVGGISNSIFQGNILISKQNLLSHFPSTSGSQVFLIDPDEEDTEHVAEALRLGLRNHGWNMEPTAIRLARFNSVENTYLSIFLAMGALGLLLGTLGLALVLALNVLERRNEIALLLAQGFSTARIKAMLYMENSILLVAGVFGGTAAAIVASLPSLTAAGADIGLSQLILLSLGIIASGFLWILVTTQAMIRTRNLKEALRND